jgi:hypothetical protein
MSKAAKQDIIIISFLTVLSVIAQIYFLNPPILSDPLEYYNVAVRFPHLPVVPNHWSLRIGLILPIAVLYRIFGHAEITYYFVSVFSSTLLIIGVYLLGKKVFSHTVGFFSAIWTIFIPGILIESGQLLPDILATTCAVLGFVFLIPGDHHRKRKWIMLVAGGLFGWSYLSKEYFVILYLLVPIVFWIYKLPLKNLIPFSIGFLLVVGLEFSLNLFTYGNPLVRFMTTNPREIWGYIEKDVFRIFTYLPILVSRNGGEGTAILFGVALIGLVGFIVKKKRNFMFLVFWVVLVYCFYTAMGLLPVILSWDDKVILRLHLYRYWIPIFPPLIITGIYTIQQGILHLLRKINANPGQVQKVANIILLSVLCFASFRGVSGIKDSGKLIRNKNDHYLELRDFLRENDDPGQVIWIVRNMKIGYDRVLPIYIHDFWGKKIWHGNFKYLNTDGQFVKSNEINEGLVIIDRFFFNPEYNRIPEYLAVHPADWELVFESENQQIALYSVE